MKKLPWIALILLIVAGLILAGCPSKRSTSGGSPASKSRSRY